MTGNNDQVAGEISTVDSLMEDGIRHIRNDDFDEALKIGRRLRRLRWSGGFEIEALALAGLERRCEAIDVLERGVEDAPAAVLLWNLLGNYRSDEARFDEALEAYDRGLAQCSEELGRFEVQLRFNRAIVYSRLDRSADALSELRGIEAGVEDPETNRELYWNLKAGIARELDIQERDAELTAFAGTMSGRCFEDDDFAEAKSELAARVACGFHRQDLPGPRTRWLRRAIELYRNERAAQWLVRELLRQEHEDGGRLFDLLIEGAWPESSCGDDCQHGFVTRYDVVADTPEEALGFIKTFEPQDVWPSLRISEIVEEGEWVDDPKGVYDVSPHYVFDPDADDDDEA